MLGFAFRVVSQVHAGCPRSDIDLLEPCHPAASSSREFFGLHHHFVPLAAMSGLLKPALEKAAACLALPSAFWALGI